MFLLTAVPTMAPESPSAVVRNSRAIFCTWDPPPQDHQNGVIIEYRINVTEIITGRVFVRLSTMTSLELTSLHPNYEYQWVVTAVTIDVGPYTSVVTIRTPEDGELVASNQSEIEIHWQSCKNCTSYVHSSP